MPDRKATPLWEGQIVRGALVDSLHAPNDRYRQAGAFKAGKDCCLAKGSLLAASRCIKFRHLRAILEDLCFLAPAQQAA